MKNTTLIYLIFFGMIITSCVNEESNTNEVKKLKVLSWNVWHGGHSKECPGKSCEGTLGILKKSDADVILMIETYGCSE